MRVICHKCGKPRKGAGVTVAVTTKDTQKCFMFCGVKCAVEFLTNLGPQGQT